MAITVRELSLVGYLGGAASRAFGFGTTFYPTVVAYVLAVILIFVR